jgi:signal transduction histidine kinase
VPRNFADRHLRIGAALLLFSATGIAAYILWNFDFHSLGPDDIDDLMLTGLAMVNAFAAIGLRRAAHVVAVAGAEREQAEREVEKHRLWLEAVVKQMPMGVGVFSSPSCDLVLTNDQYHDLLRISPDRASSAQAGSSSRSFDTLGEPFDSIRAPSRRALQGETTRDVEIKIERGDGKKVWLAVSAAPICDRAGTISAAVIAFIDVTERRAAAAERANLMRGVINAQESERLRIARELHDELGQDLTGLSIGLKTLEASAYSGDRCSIQKLRTKVEAMNEHVHELTARLRPLMLDDFGLEQALKELTLAWGERLGVATDVHLDGLSHPMTDAMEIAVYRVVQESLTNIAKHAEATAISVTTQRSNGALRVVIEDNGKGFSTNGTGKVAGRHYGIAGMAERLSVVGGQLHVESSPGAGTTVFATVPSSLEVV